MGVSMLMLALYYELPEVAMAIRAQLPKLTFFEAAAIGDAGTVQAHIRETPDDVNAFSPDGFTVLGLAVFFRQPAIARFLIAAGADVNLPANNARKVAPIHAACARQDYETLALLLEHGANPDAAQEGGSTPLKEAVHRGDQRLEAMLRGAGAVEG